MGSGEILVIALIALVVLGPEKLPKLAADLGRWVGRARAMARQLRAQLDQEVHLEEMRRLEREAQARMDSQVIPPTAPAPAAAPAEATSPASPAAPAVATPAAVDAPAVTPATPATPAATGGLPPPADPAPAIERTADGQH